MQEEIFYNLIKLKPHYNFVLYFGINKNIDFWHKQILLNYDKINSCIEFFLYMNIKFKSKIKKFKSKAKLNYSLNYIYDNLNIKKNFYISGVINTDIKNIKLLLTFLCFMLEIKVISINSELERQVLVNL